MRPTAALVLLLGAAGCLSEEARTLASWEGVYEVQRATENSEDCSMEGEQADLTYGFFEIDTEPGVDAHLVELRSCSTAESCEPVGFLTFLATTTKERSMVGARDEIFYTVVGDQGGLCQALHEEVELARSGPNNQSLRVEIFSGVATDVIAPTQEVCINLLSAIADDPDGCDTYRVFEARRVF